MRTPPTNICEQLKLDEGFTRFPKPDSHGTFEIGYGFNLELAGIFEDEATAVLQLRVVKLQSQLRGLLPWTDSLDTVRLGVLQNMGYEMGLAGLVSFHDMLSEMQVKNWTLAAHCMRESLWAKQVPERAGRLATQMETGAWQ